VGSPAFSVLCLGSLLGLMTLVWVLSVPLHDVSIVDVVWSLNFVVVAVLAWVFGGGDPDRRLLALLLVTPWALRLSLHILRRNRGKGEDPRYRAFRLRYGAQRYWWVSLFQVFLLQGLLAFVVSMPLQSVGVSIMPRGLTWVDALAVVVWGAGFAFEAIGDAQLTAFKKDPENRGRVMDRGLWRYTRHPNYFGDATLWWGIGILALQTSWWWAGLLGPAVMTFMLVRVSGVAMLEKTIGERRPGYEEYVRRTSAFIPARPRRVGDAS
jgi:steroid 5-alpha reductase family enzyme